MTEHGISGYRRGCKCSVCRAANAEYMREYRLAGGADPVRRDLALGRRALDGLHVLIRSDATSEATKAWAREMTGEVQRRMAQLVRDVEGSPKVR